MSFAAIDPVGATAGAASGSTPPPAPTAAAVGAQAATARVAELRQMISQAEQGTAASNGGATFADALAGATAPSATAAAVSVTAAYPGASPATGVAGTNVAAAGGSGSTPYDGLVTAAAQRYGIDPALLHGLIQQESGFDPAATSSAGALGLTQLMPGTASSLGVTDPLDPAQSIDGGARYLRQQLDAFGGDSAKALAAYNAGPGAVQRYGGVPPYAETQAYVQKVTGYANAYRSAQGAAGAAALPPTTPPYSIS